MGEEKKQITKPFFDKTNYVFEYPIEDVYNFVNKTLDKEDLNNYTHLQLDIQKHSLFYQRTAMLFVSFLHSLFLSP
jgi:hypothetical protein